MADNRAKQCLHKQRKEKQLLSELTRTYMRKKEKTRINNSYNVILKKYIRTTWHRPHIRALEEKTPTSDKILFEATWRMNRAKIL